MKLKLGPPVEVKVVDEHTGEIEAVFSTLKVVDKDKDVTLPGAFGEQNVRISAYNHQSWGNELPIGKGTIREVGDEAILSGRFFMEVPKARDTFVTIKELGELMEWSYGYDVLERSSGQWPPEKDAEETEDVQLLKKLKVHEVSPVILGAGENTRTLSAKRAGSIPLSPKDWAEYQEARKEALKQAMTADQVEQAMAVVGQITDALSNKDNPPTVASLDTLIGKLEDACGCSDSDDSGMSALNFVGGVKLSEHLAWADSQLEIVSNRVAEAVAQRADNGQTLAEPTLESVKSILTQCDRLREALAIQPRKANQEVDPAFLDMNFREARALLHLSERSEFE